MGRNDWMDKKLDEDIAEDKIHQDVIDEVLHEQAHAHRWKWQGYLEKFILLTPLQIILMVLAIIDVLVVLSEILINLNIYMIEAKEAQNALNETMGSLNGAMHTHHHYLHDALHDMEGRLGGHQAPHLPSENNSHSTDNNHAPSDPHSPTDTHQNNTIHTIETGKSDPHHLVSLYEPYTNVIPEDLLVRVKRAGSGGASGAYNTGLHHTQLIKTLHKTERILNIISIVILGIFVVFVFLEILVEGLHFFKQIMKIIDSVVTILSFILDVIKFSRVLSKEVMDAIIVILLLWQIVRMFNGIMLSEIKRLEFRIKLQRKARKKLDTKYKETIQDKKLAETEVKSLQNLSRRKGIPEEDISMCHPARIAAKPSASTGISMIAMMTMGLKVEDDMIPDKKSIKKGAAKPAKYLQIAPLKKSPSVQSHLGDKGTEKGALEQMDTLGTESMTKAKSEDSKDPSTDEGFPQEPSSSSPPSSTPPLSLAKNKLKKDEKDDVFDDEDTSKADNEKYDYFFGDSVNEKRPQNMEGNAGNSRNIGDNENDDRLQQAPPPVYVYKPLWKDEDDDRRYGDDIHNDIRQGYYNSKGGYGNDRRNYDKDYNIIYDDNDDRNNTNHVYGHDNPAYQHLPLDNDKKEDDYNPHHQPHNRYNDNN